jgi:hypothetical protein
VQLVVKKAAAWLVGLKPLAIYHELWDGSFADVADEFIRGRLIQIDIDFCVFDPVLFEKLFGGPAIPAPLGRVNLHLHTFILLCLADSIPS